MRGRRHASPTPVHQHGMATLIVSLLLLGIISIMTLFAFSYGVRDRRAIADEMTQRLAQEAAQAGLDQGMLFFRAKTSEVLMRWLMSQSSEGPGWQRCEATDVTVPCGAAAEPVRANYWRYRAGSAAGVDSRLAMAATFADEAGKPQQQLIGRMGDHEIGYDVYALLCLVDTEHPEQQCRVSDPVGPQRKIYDGPFAITLIARSRIAGAEGGRQAVVKETIAARGSGDGNALSRLGVVPGSWSDAGRIDAENRYVEN